MESKKPERRRRKKMSGGISLREMEEVAINFGDSFSGDDIGNIIDLNSGGDDLGLGMLANPSKSSDSGSGMGNTYSVPPPANTSSSLNDIEITSLDNSTPLTLNMGGSGSSSGSASAPIEFELHRSDDYSNSQTATGPSINLTPASTRANQEEEKKEKIEYLNKLQRLEQKGFPVSRRYTMDNSLDEMKQEYLRLVDARNLEASLRFQRQAMIGIVTGLEWLNGRFDPFDLKLDGWSESVHENVEDFDEIFEELYDKYKDRGKMPPELRLVTSLAGSGFMCHVSNTFLKSRMPSAEDVLRQNPDLARQFATAAAQSAGPGFGNFMGMAMGVPQQQQQQGPQPSQATGPTGAFFQASQQQQPQRARAPQAVASVERAEAAVEEQQRQTARREMRGPTGVDDILRTFEEARAREMNDIPPAAGPQAAVTAAVEIQSMTSEDIGSAVESTRTGRTGGGRRRRQAVGNTVSLAV